jgi:hypothetical protein
MALHTSLEEHVPGTRLHVLVIDPGPDEPVPTMPRSGVTIMHLDELRDGGIADAIMAKYALQPDELRWSLKSILLLHLLKQHEKVAYCD